MLEIGLYALQSFVLFVFLMWACRAFASENRRVAREIAELYDGALVSYWYSPFIAVRFQVNGATYEFSRWTYERHIRPVQTRLRAVLKEPQRSSFYFIADAPLKLPDGLAEATPELTLSDPQLREIYSPESNDLARTKDIILRSEMEPFFKKIDIPLEASCRGNSISLLVEGDLGSRERHKVFIDTAVFVAEQIRETEQSG